MQKSCRQCPKCYSIEMPNAVFCSQCGNSFYPNNTRSNQVPAQSLFSSTSKIVLGSGILGFLFLLVLSIAVSVRNNPQPQPTQATLIASSSPTIPAELANEISATAAKTIVGKVVGVSDGDTVTVLDSKNQQYKIRLEGVDAPESKQDFGEKAKQNLSSLIYGKTVTVLSNKTDKYGRTVGKILLDGKDINLEQIKSGYAWHYKAYASEQSEADQKLYSDAEVTARKAKLNLWSMPNPTAPWDFRHGANVSPDDAKKIFGNKNSLIYHWAGCPGFTKIGANNKVVFASPEEAEAAGYRAAKNCSTPKPAAKAEEESKESPNSETETLEAQLPPPQNEIKSADLPASPHVSQSQTRTTETSPTSYERPSTSSIESSASSSSATARCADGTLSYSANRRGTCSHHGGVAQWLSGASSSAPTQTYIPPARESSGYHTGPRGGCYTYSSSGRKRYVDRSLCH